MDLLEFLNWMQLYNASFVAPRLKVANNVNPIIFTLNRGIFLIDADLPIPVIDRVNTRAYLVSMVDYLQSVPVLPDPGLPDAAAIQRLIDNLP